MKGFFRWDKNGQVSFLPNIYFCVDHNNNVNKNNNIAEY